MDKNDPAHDDFHDCSGCGRAVTECECDDPWDGEDDLDDADLDGGPLPTGDDLLDKHHAALMARERTP